MQNLLKKDVLTGLDYATVPIEKLIKHPNFNNRAMNIIMKIMSMSTKQIEQLNILEGDK